MAQELDDVVGAVAQDQVGRFHPQFGRQLLLEIKGVAVRIQMQLPGGPAHRGQRGGGRPERIFVRGQLDDLARGQSQFPRHLLDGPARLIDRQMFQDGI